MLGRRELVLNDAPDTTGKCVMYVMSRDMRLQDNHALLAAQQEALDAKIPLLIVFALMPKLGVRAQEQYAFMVAGLKELAAQAATLHIGFDIQIGPFVEVVQAAIAQHQPAHVFFDFSPLRGPRSAQKTIAKNAPCTCTVVDTHNTIPLWVASDKEEFAAHTMRTKVHKQLSQWLVEPEQLTAHPYPMANPPKPDWKAVDDTVRSIDSCGISVAFEPGEMAAHDALTEFITTKLADYATTRNDPSLDAQSDLSPYLHFGQLSALRVALCVIEQMDEPPLLLRESRLASAGDAPTFADSANALLEELIVRKELADNYCFYNDHYDSLAGAKDWARTTLAEHADDPREFVYDIQILEKGKTHDAIWNAAQHQMTRTGKMHGYMRMYWAKKILEWSPSADSAIERAIYLNDHYSIDGGDPNGYVGIMWSIAGVHDRPWFDRPVFGKIRFMNDSGLRRKFNVDAYCEQWK